MQVILEDTEDVGDENRQEILFEKVDSQQEQPFASMKDSQRTSRNSSKREEDSARSKLSKQSKKSNEERQAQLKIQVKFSTERFGKVVERNSTPSP